MMKQTVVIFSHLIYDWGSKNRPKRVTPVIEIIDNNRKPDP